MAGWSLYIDEAGRVTYLYNWMGHQSTFATVSNSLLPGPHHIEVEFAYDGGFGAGGTVLVSVDSSPVASSVIAHTVPIRVLDEWRDLRRRHRHGRPGWTVSTSVSLHRGDRGRDVGTPQ